MSENPVREDASRVLDSLECVSINPERIDEFARDLVRDSTPLDYPSWDQPVFPPRRTQLEDVVNYFLVGNTLNFCFHNVETGERFAARYDGKEYTGAYAMWACLRKAKDNGLDLTDAHTLATLSRYDFSEAFKPSNGVAMPLLSKRHTFLRKTGETLLDRYDGSFLTLFDNAGYLYNNGDGFVEQLVENFDAYQDSRELAGHTVRFDKRAQLAAAMLYGRYVTPFEDTHNLTLFADYVLPAVLAANRLIAYDSELLETVTSGKHIPEGSREEVEIRVATIAAGDRLLKSVNSYSDTEITIPQLDYYLWRQHDECTAPHRTLTTSY